MGCYARDWARKSSDRSCVRRAIAAASATSPRSAGSTAAAASIRTVRARTACWPRPWTTPGPWRARSARAAAAIPGIRDSRTATPPAAALPAVLAVLETPGWALAAADAKIQLGAVLERLRSAGVALLDRRTSALVEQIESSIADARALSNTINTWEFRWPLNTFARDGDPTKLSPFMRAKLVEAERMTLEEYQAALERRAAIRAIFAGLAASAQAAITLSAPDAAPPGLQSTGEPAFVVAGSLLGVPAVSLPLLQTQGLPLGVQLLGFADRDAALFGVAAAVERVTGEPERDSR